MSIARFATVAAPLITNLDFLSQDFEEFQFQSWIWGNNLNKISANSTFTQSLKILLEKMEKINNENIEEKLQSILLENKAELYDLNQRYQRLETLKENSLDPSLLKIRLKIEKIEHKLGKFEEEKVIQSENKYL